LAGGYGLAGIAERVASCGGSLALGPAPDGGFTVTARLPLT
jgi:signal transduction histidine kinase